MQDRFRQAVLLMGKAGYDDISAKLEKALHGLSEETYKIAVVGEFKTGKSTLINRVFLKDDLLFTDILEATAVPTEVCFGTQKYLEIIPYTPDYSEGQPVRISHPTAEDIQAHTSADTPEKRARLARQTARARLCRDSKNLSGLIVFDTPGINSLNEAVIATTYRIIPESDLVLFVTSAKQLSEVETEFLSGRIFAQGIVRVMAVITYDPHAGSLSAEQQQNLMNTIRSQLAGIGRSYIPVEMVNIRDQSAASGKSFMDKLEAKTADKAQSKEQISDVIADLLGNRSLAPVSKISEPENNFASLEEKLIRFIRDNVRPARMEKMVRILDAQLRLAQVRCDAELSAMTRTEAQRRALLADIRAKEAETRLKYERLTIEFKDELHRIERAFARDMEAGIHRIADNYLSGVDACKELGELQNRLKRAGILLKRDMEELFSDCSFTAKEKIRAMIETYGIRSQALFQPWQAQIGSELRIDGGILSKIPPYAVLALDMLLFVQFGPFGPLGDVLVRLAADYIPLLNKAMPVAIAASVLKINIRNSVRDQFERIKAEMPLSIEKTFDALGDKLILEWKAYSDEQLGAVRKSVESTLNQPVNFERFEILTDVKKKLAAMIV